MKRSNPDKNGDDESKEGPNRKKSRLDSPDKPSPKRRVSGTASPTIAASHVDPKPAIQEGSAIDMPALKRLARRLSEISAMRYRPLESKQEKQDRQQKEETPVWSVCFLENCAFDTNVNRLRTSGEFNRHLRKEHGGEGPRELTYTLLVLFHNESSTPEPKADMSHLNQLLQRLTGTRIVFRGYGDDSDTYHVCLLEGCGFDKSIQRFDDDVLFNAHFENNHRKLTKHECYEVRLMIIHEGVAALRNAPEKSTTPAKPTEKEYPTFICGSCGCEYRIVKSCEKHEKMHSLKLPLTCGPCRRLHETPKTTAGLQTLEQLGKGTQQIPTSSTHKGSPNQSAVTVTAVTKETKTNFKCVFCKSIFRSRTAVTNHLPCERSKSHFEICQKCLVFFKTEEELQSHKKDMHPSGYHKCPNCRRNYAGQHYTWNLNYHVLKSHGNQPICPLCFQCSSSTNKLQRHMSDFHPGISLIVQA